jgi:hypothetical protein
MTYGRRTVSVRRFDRGAGTMSTRTGQIPALSLASRPVDKNSSSSLDCACHEIARTGLQFQSSEPEPVHSPRAVTPSRAIRLTCDFRRYSSSGRSFQLLRLHDRGVGRGNRGRRRHGRRSASGSAVSQLDECQLWKCRRGKHRDAERNADEYGNRYRQSFPSGGHRSRLHGGGWKPFTLDRCWRDRYVPASVCPDLERRRHG